MTRGAVVSASRMVLAASDTGSVSRGMTGVSLNSIVMFC